MNRDGLQVTYGATLVSCKVGKGPRTVHWDLVRGLLLTLKRYSCA